MKDNGDVPSDIRQREVKLGNFDPNNCNLFVNHYEGSGGDEYFISYENRMIRQYCMASSDFVSIIGMKLRMKLKDMLWVENYMYMASIQM